MFNELMQTCLLHIRSHWVLSTWECKPGPRRCGMQLLLYARVGLTNPKATALQPPSLIGLSRIKQRIIAREVGGGAAALDTSRMESVCTGKRERQGRSCQHTRAVTYGHHRGAHRSCQGRESHRGQGETWSSLLDLCFLP